MATYVVNPNLTVEELDALREKKHQEFLTKFQRMLNHPVIAAMSEFRGPMTEYGHCVEHMLMISKRMEELLYANTMQSRSR